MTQLGKCRNKNRKKVLPRHRLISDVEIINSLFKMNCIPIVFSRDQQIRDCVNQNDRSERARHSSINLFCSQNIVFVLTSVPDSR